MKFDYSIIKSVSLGIEYIEENDKKLIFSRFSKQDRQLLEYGRDNSFATAGVSLEFITDSKSLNVGICSEYSIISFHTLLPL